MPAAIQTFSERDFRDALGRFATGVAVVSASVEGERIGATISSFNSVSLTPPLILFSLATSARSIDLWRRAERFAVTILKEDATDLSNRFARAGEDKWTATRFDVADDGTPYFPDQLATYFCRRFAKHDGGDHEIFIGEVTSFLCETGRPLLFYSGRYQVIDRSLTTPKDTDFLLHGW